MSGRASTTVSTAPALRRKSGVSTSMVVAGVRARMARMVWAKCSAPPSARSSRSTEVMTTCSSPSLATASATFSGSLGIERPRQPGRHVAEGAGARAGVAHDHHGGVALRPALADVGAGRLLAHRDEPVLAQHAARLAVLRPTRPARARGSSPACAAPAYPACWPSRGAAAARLSRIVTMPPILPPPVNRANPHPAIPAPRVPAAPPPALRARPPSQEGGGRCVQRLGSAPTFVIPASAATAGIQPSTRPLNAPLDSRSALRLAGMTK